jgi:nucleotide-binding universal stress UspA family protein
MNASHGPVLVAYDGSASAHRAVADAAELLRPLRTLVVTVWEPGLAYVSMALRPDGMLPEPMVDPAVAEDVDRELRLHAERVAGEGSELARSLGLDAEPLAAPDSGDVAQTILEVAREHQARVIVVGSRGLGGIRAALEGSTSRGLLRHAPCPVLVSREP